MAATDFKITVIGAVNEVRRRNKLAPVTSLDQDSDALTKLSYLNDVIADLSDYGRWQEQLRTTVISAQSSVVDYAVSGVVVQNIQEISYSTRSGEMRLVTLDQMRRLQRTASDGQPTQYAIKGVTSEGNPIFTVHPRPVNNLGFFDVLYYQKPALYTTADGNELIPFPSRVVVQGLLTEIILDESDGEPTTRYLTNFEKYQAMKKESFNRFNGDTGSTTYFKPARGNRA